MGDGDTAAGAVYRAGLAGDVEHDVPVTSEMDPDLPARELARVRKAHAMGAFKYILLRGIGGWGLPTFVIFTVLPAFRAVPWFPMVATRPSIFVPIGAVIWFGGGFALGLWMWKSVSKRFAELAAEEEA